MQTIILLKFLEIWSNPKKKIALIFGVIATLFLLLWIIVKIMTQKKVAKALESQRGKQIRSNDSQVIKSISELSSEDRIELFMNYEKLINPFDDNELGDLLPHIYLPSVAFQPLPNTRETLAKMRCSNTLTGKSVVVSVDAHGIYSKERKGKPYYYIVDDSDGGMYEVDLEPKQLHDFLRKKLELKPSVTKKESITSPQPIYETLNKEKPIEINQDIQKEAKKKLTENQKESDTSPEETNILEKSIDRTQVDEFLKNQEKVRIGGDLELEKVKGISSRFKSRMTNDVGILCLEDLAELPASLYQTVAELMGTGVYPKHIAKWSASASDILNKVS